MFGENQVCGTEIVNNTGNEKNTRHAKINAGLQDDV